MESGASRRKEIEWLTFESLWLDPKEPLVKVQQQSTIDMKDRTNGPGPDLTFSLYILTQCGLALSCIPQHSQNTLGVTK
jgi:hypothetical protein